MRAVILPNVSKWRQEVMKPKAAWFRRTNLESKNKGGSDNKGDGRRKNEFLLRELVAFDRNSGMEQLLRPFRCWL